MVRAKVKQSVQTKQYEWEVLDEKNEDMFEIETPGHNLLLLRNFHLPDSWQAFVTGTLGHVEFSDEMANLIPDSHVFSRSDCHPQRYSDSRVRI